MPHRTAKCFGRDLAGDQQGYLRALLQELENLSFVHGLSFHAAINDLGEAGNCPCLVGGAAAAEARCAA